MLLAYVAERRTIMTLKQKAKAILLTDRILRLVQNADFNLLQSEQHTRVFVHKNRGIFKTCYTSTDIANCLQNLLIAEGIEDLLKEAGLEWPKRYAQNVASDWENVFRECETREEAIQRLKYLDQVISF